MSIKVMVAFSNVLFSEGVKMLLEGADSEDFKVEEVFKAGSSPYKMIEDFVPDVILIDLITLYNEFGEIGQGHKLNLILLDSGCGPDNIASAIAAKKLKGVLAENTSPPLLKRAIRAVADGGEWFNPASFNNLPTI
mgnify:CR=1 FL=1